jgi:hypothetical protein
MIDRSVVPSTTGIPLKNEVSDIGEENAISEMACAHL